VVRIADDPFRTSVPIGEPPIESREGAMAEPGYQGAHVRELPRANRTYPGGRVCAAEGCETKLSIYNKWEFCWQHEPVHTFIARGKRRSRKEMEAA
jgi:hypothetical protein